LYRIENTKPRDVLAKRVHSTRTKKIRKDDSAYEIIARPKEKNKTELTQTQYFVVVALPEGGSAHMSKRNSRYTVYGIDIMLWYVDHHGPCTS